MQEPSGVGTPPGPSLYARTHARISRLVGMDIDDYIRADSDAHAALETAKWARVWKAMQLAHNVVTCRALLRGERIPWQALDYFQGERYGLRPQVRNAEGRYTLEDFNDVPKP